MSVSNSMKAPTDPAVDAAMEEFLANGGKIQYCAPNASGRSETSTYSAWGAPKKKKSDSPLAAPLEDLED